MKRILFLLVLSVKILAASEKEKGYKAYTMVQHTYYTHFDERTPEKIKTHQQELEKNLETKGMQILALPSGTFRIAHSGVGNEDLKISAEKVTIPKHKIQFIGNEAADILSGKRVGRYALFRRILGKNESVQLHEYGSKGQLHSISNFILITKE